MHPRTQTSRCQRLGTARAARFRAKMVAPYRATRVMGVADPRRKMTQSSQRPPGLTRGMQAQPGRHARLSLRVSVSNLLIPSRLPSRPLRCSSFLPVSSAHTLPLCCFPILHLSLSLPLPLPSFPHSPVRHVTGRCNARN